MPLHTDYRPEDLDQMVGNETLMKSLRGAIDRDKPFKTFLFTGASGCGKTTVARILKNELGVSDHDYRYFNASNTRGIDTVREVIIEMQLAPMEGKYRMYVFDECHQLTPQAQEALLKDTEEPPDHVFFVFCTTDPEKLKPTFKRRGFQGQVEKLLRKDIMYLLKDVIDAEIYYWENKQATPKIERKIKRLKAVPDEILSEVTSASDGSPGQALKLLDQVIEMDDLSDAKSTLHSIFGDESTILEIAQTITDQRIQSETKWNKVRKLLAAIDAEPEAIRKGILTYLGKLMLGAQASPEIAEMILILGESTMYSYRAGLIAQCYVACRVSGQNV